MNWQTNTSTSESQTVAFDAPVKGTALRIYVMEARNPYVIDELTVGISVDEKDMGIYLDHDTLTLYEGETAALAATVTPESATNKNVKWSTSNEDVLRVDNKGNLTVVGLPEGESSAVVTITATTEYGGKSASCTVTVLPKKADEADKAATAKRIENAKKLANAAKQADYQEGAIASFLQKLNQLEAQLQGNITLGELVKMDKAIADAQTEFELKSYLPIQETKRLIDRITGTGSSDSFQVELIPADSESGMDVYEVDWDAATQKIVLRGNNGVALATAYNYYLKYYAYLDFPYVGQSNLTLPSPLPEVSEKVRIVFPYEYRHYFNENCEYKYTTALYGEAEWQHRIDWMAMNGFNMFLVDLGDLAIWTNAKQELGLNDEALQELRRSSKGDSQYFAQYELSEQAVQAEGDLAKKVVQMAYRLGMEPEIRPFVGQVPFMFPNQHDAYYGEASKPQMTIELPGSIFDGMFLYSGARWMNLPQGVFISPETAAADSAKREEMNQKFVQIAEIYYDSLLETLGFHELGRTPKFAYKDLIGEQGFVVSHEAFPRKVLTEMQDQIFNLNPDTIWMQTSWRYQTWLTQYYKEGHLMFVDLSADNRPKWNTNNEFGHTPWLWSMLFNFGGNTGMGGGLDRIAQGVLKDYQSSSYMKGVSISPEGGDTNPALYALMAEMTWRSTPPDVEAWLKDYAKRRYGAENYEAAKTEIDSAWKQLHETVYSDFVTGDGPSQTVLNALPKLNGAIARVYGSNAKVYESKDIFPIWETMLEAAKKMPSMTEQFQYDLVDITRQALGDLSGDVYANILPNFNKLDKENTMKYADLMVELCSDMDSLLATAKEFLLGTRLAGAKGRGVTVSDQEYYEKLERTFLTYWVLDNPDESGGLTDYCNRHLSGLMNDYYKMRWETFAKYLEQGLEQGLNSSEFNSSQQPVLAAEIKANVVAWTNDHTPYPTQETGDPLAISAQLFGKYRSLIQELYSSADDSKDLPVEGMTVTAGNQQADKGAEGPANNVLDNKTDTVWHTAWSGCPREEQYLIFDLGGEKTVDGLRYLPRQSGVNGIITQYKIAVSTDGGATFEKVTEGDWDESPAWKLASFPATKATHVKLMTVNSVSTTDKLFASAAEVRITAPRPVDKNALKDVVDSAEAITDSDNYTEESWTAFQNALNHAKAVLDDTSASQDAVDKAQTDLQDALDGLTPKPDQQPANKTALEKLYNDNKDKINDNYTEESWTAFQNALNHAKAILDDTSASQDAVDKAQADLQDAAGNLVKKNDGSSSSSNNPDDNKPSSNPNSGEDGKTPTTGDISMAPMMLLFMGSGLTALTLIYRRKKAKLLEK